MAGVDLDPVRELEQPVQRVEEPLRALSRLDGEVGACGVADEERVTGEDEPGLVGPAAVADRDARARAGGPAWIARRTTVPSSSSAPSSRASCGYSAAAAGWIETGMPCSSARRP